MTNNAGIRLRRLLEGAETDATFAGAASTAVVDSEAGADGAAGADCSAAGIAADTGVGGGATWVAGAAAGVGIDPNAAAGLLSSFMKSGDTIVPLQCGQGPVVGGRLMGTRMRPLQ